MDIKDKKVLTPRFRVSFPHVFKPKKFDEKQEPKFSVTMLFSKKTDISALRKAADNAAIEKWGTDKKKWPKGLVMPFRDGDEQSDLKGYAGCWTVRATANADKKPEVINNDEAKSSIESPDEFYPGCYARATLIAFAYGGKGTPFKPGVSFALGNLQKLADGESLSSKPSAEEDFADEAESDGADDESSYESDDGDSDSVDLGF